MAKTTASRKQKGRNLQKEVVKRVLELFPELTERDVVSTPMGVFGKDVMLSEAAIVKFPYAVECKCQEAFSIWASLKQAEQDNRDKDLTNLLVFKRNHTDVYCALKLDDFLKLLRQNQ